MSQEYVLAAGWYWRLMGKRVYLWRNHYSGSVFTDIAAVFCVKIFCTSKFSYTAKYKKTVFMPIGVDLEVFKPMQGSIRKPRSILFLSRMSPSKRPIVLIDALAALKKKGAEYYASFIGDPKKGDEEYYKEIKREGEFVGAVFGPAVPNRDTSRLYSENEIFVNCSPSGMYDKTIFEAAACGALPLASSGDWREAAGEDLWFAGDAQSLAQKLDALFSLSAEGRRLLQERARALAQGNGLQTLIMRLTEEVR
jgi:glycosyltransferase involved in cell wall biosynthesis